MINNQFQQNSHKSSKVSIELKERFYKFMTLLTVDHFKGHYSPEHFETLWNNIEYNYSLLNRYYHTLNHLQHIFRHYDSVHSLLNNPDTVALAIWYHDIIYQPTLMDNERKSADYFIQQWSEALSDSIIHQVESLIMMTASHQIESIDELKFNDLNADIKEEILGDSIGFKKPILQDAQLFLDMDLSILGSDWEQYLHYAKQVRLEYQHVSLTDYNKGRRFILENFLKRERLYFSKMFFDKYELQARQNIKQEIAQLLT